MIPRFVQSATDVALAYTLATVTWTVALTCVPVGIGCAVCLVPAAQAWRDTAAYAELDRPDQQEGR